MNFKENFLEEQKEALLKEREVIENKLKNLETYPDYGADEEDNIQEVEDYETNLSLGEQLNSLLKKIDKALSAIEKGTYGTCKQCGEKVEEGRLKVIPYAELCVTCKSKSSKR